MPANSRRTKWIPQTPTLCAKCKKEPAAEQKIANAVTTHLCHPCGMLARRAIDRGEPFDIPPPPREPLRAPHPKAPPR